MFTSVTGPSLVLKYRLRNDTIYSFSVLLLKTGTWWAGLTLAPEGSGSLVKPQPVNVFCQLRFCSHWGYRTSGNKKWEVVQQTSSLVCKRCTQSSLNGFTHLSLRRLLFTCRAPANSCTDVIALSLRLQNVREQMKERYGVQEIFQQQYITN